MFRKKKISVEFWRSLGSYCFYLSRILYFFHFFFWHLYWSIIALQWYVSFCCITTESVIYIHISPHPLPLVSASHPPYPTPLGGHKAPTWSPCAMRLLLTSYFTFGSVYMFMPLSDFVPAYPSPSPCPQVHSLHLCLYSCPALRFFKTIFNFFRFHICVLAYGICFSLSDLLHSVWQTLGPSTSLQLTQFCFFLWLSSIPLYICATSSLSIHLSMDTKLASMSWLL